MGSASISQRSAITVLVKRHGYKPPALFPGYCQAPQRPHFPVPDVYAGSFAALESSIPDGYAAISAANLAGKHTPSVPMQGRPSAKLRICIEKQRKIKSLSCKKGSLTLRRFKRHAQACRMLYRCIETLCFLHRAGRLGASPMHVQ